MFRPIRLALVLSLLILSAGASRGDVLPPQSEVHLGAGAGCSDPRPEIAALSEEVPPI